MASPQFTIITVCFNAASTIRNTIESVLKQVGVTFEYIIIDGGSSDGTIDIIDQYSEKLAYWVSEKDSGIYDAMNKGICRASGSIVGIINSDDIYLPGALFDVLQQHLLNPRAVIHGNLEISEYGKAIGKWIGKSPCGINSQYRKMTVYHPTTFVPLCLYNTFGMYSTEYKLSSDYDFLLKMIKGGVTFVHLNRCIARFNLGGGSGGINTYMETYRIQRKFGRGLFDAQAWLILSIIKMSIKYIAPRCYI